MKLTEKQIVTVTKTIALIAENPPKGESWNRPGEVTLAGQLIAWLKDQM